MVLWHTFVSSASWFEMNHRIYSGHDVKQKSLEGYIVDKNAIKALLWRFLSLLRFL